MVNFKVLEEPKSNVLSTNINSGDSLSDINDFYIYSIQDRLSSENYVSRYEYCNISFISNSNLGFKPSSEYYLDSLINTLRNDRLNIIKLVLQKSVIHKLAKLIDISKYKEISYQVIDKSKEYELKLNFLSRNYSILMNSLFNGRPLNDRILSDREIAYYISDFMDLGLLSSLIKELRKLKDGGKNYEDNYKCYLNKDLEKYENLMLKIKFDKSKGDTKSIVILAESLYNSLEQSLSINNAIVFPQDFKYIIIKNNFNEFIGLDENEMFIIHLSKDMPTLFLGIEEPIDFLRVSSDIFADSFMDLGVLEDTSFNHITFLDK